MKHIESIQPEYAAEELERIVREEGDATASAALSRLLHDWTGCDIPQTDITPQSEVEELVPLCLSILRRHWTTPLTALGDGTTPMSLADLMRRLILGRVDGNEALGILPANDNIPTAVSALRERKIGGVPEAPDGVSFARLLCDSTIPPITELIDDNIGWVMDKAHNFNNMFTERMAFNCVEITSNLSSNSNALLMDVRAEVVEFPYLKRITRTSPPHSIIIWGNGVKTISMPMLEYGELLNYTDCGAFRGENLEEILLPSIKHIPLQAQYSLCTPSPKLRKVVFGTMTSFPSGIRFLRRQITGKEDSCPNLIHIEFGQGTDCSIGLQNWLNDWDEPLALSTSDSSLVVDGFANNREQFLSNFRLYIADRLSGYGSGKTLTLSQEVRDAIHSAGIDTIITNKGWTISPVPTQQ